jgi:4-diphosphocytidyl-2-C-methyl-D-erythritol kinase
MADAVLRAPAPAKINLALVVGPLRPDGKHEVATVLQRVDLGDRVTLRRGAGLRVDGFAEDTIVRCALERLAARAGTVPRWHVRIEKHVPVAAGLGGGSSDAATALRLANQTLASPLPEAELSAVAAEIGSDVPFFLCSGPALGTGDGSELETLQLPQDYWVVLVLPRGAVKASTADVYRRFDERRGEAGFAERRAGLLEAVGSSARARDLARLPPNDLARSPLARLLVELGAFRGDVSGAGPAVYGLFFHRDAALAAARSLRGAGRTWVTAPAWYG